MLIVEAGDLERRPTAIKAALDAGVDAIQLRDPRAGGGALLQAARTLRTLTHASGATLVVNDRIDVARAAAADGVHLPAASFPIATARALLGPAAWIGRSTHAPEEAAAAATAGADYVILGPIFPTPSKARYGAPLGIATVAATSITVPLIAIGGVTAARVPELRRAGAAGIAVVREILDAPDHRAAARALIAALVAPLS
jgi:thiamine-phosphate pyrophosphorylase